MEEEGKEEEEEGECEAFRSSSVTKGLDVPSHSTSERLLRCDAECMSLICLEYGRATVNPLQCVLWCWKKGIGEVWCYLLTSLHLQ